MEADKQVAEVPVEIAPVVNPAEVVAAQEEAPKDVAAPEQTATGEPPKEAVEPAKEPPAEAMQTEEPALQAAAAIVRGRKNARQKSTLPSAPKKKAVSGRFLDKVISARKKSGIYYHSNLFRCVRSDLINADGDIRHFGCVAMAQMGPFAPGAKIEVIDWVGSANLLLISQTGKIADTVILPLTESSLASQTPIEP